MLFGTMLTTVTSCDKDDEPSSDSIVGTWKLSLKNSYDGSYWYCQYNFKKDGSFEVKDWNSSSKEPEEYEETGKWSTNNNHLTLNFVEAGYTETYSYELNGKELIIYDYEEDGPNIFKKL